MAQVIPKTLMGSVPSEVARVFQKLKSLPDDWRVWYRIPWNEDEAPDFMVLDSDGRALLLQVSRATSQQAQQAPQYRLLGIELDETTPGEREEQILGSFLALTRREGVSRDAAVGAVIFPNLADKDLNVIQQAGVAPQYQWLDRDWLNGRGVSSWRELLGDLPLDGESLQILRGQFSPETIIPASFVARTTHRRSTRARLSKYLLDYNQEEVLKTDLDLPAEGQRLAQELKVQLVNGVAGSGKTLILLYRLRLLHALFPTKRFLVLTHNKPLVREMESRFALLTESCSERISWSTFSGLCYTMWHPSTAHWRNPLSIRERAKLLHSVWRSCLQETRVTERMFIDELGWFKDNGLAGRDEYLQTDRRGRGFRLTQEQREQMFGAMSEYQRRLFARGRLDWWDVPRRLWHWIEAGEVEPDQYDVVLVDEAQFFAPVWFQIVQRVVLPDLGYLFLAADPTQGFLRRGESWKSVAGLEVRGRSHQLRQSYRTTRAILRFAWTWYQGRRADDDIELLPPSLSGMRQGQPPLLIQSESPQDEQARIVNEISNAIQEGLPARQVLVLHESWRGVNALLEMLNRRLGEGMARDPKDAGSGEWVRVTTINAGTGLESPLVFIAGMGRLFEEEEGLLLTEGDRADLVRQNTRKLYMAFTRAGQRLVLTCTGELSVSLRRLEEQGLLEVTGEDIAR